MNSLFQIGDSVTLSSGGIPMTVWNSIFVFGWCVAIGSPHCDEECMDTGASFEKRQHPDELLQIKTMSTKDPKFLTSEDAQLRIR